MLYFICRFFCYTAFILLYKSDITHIYSFVQLSLANNTKFCFIQIGVLFQKILFKLMEIFLLIQFAALHFILFYQILKEIIYLILFLHFQIKHINQNLNINMIKMMKFLNFVNFAFLKQK